MGYQGRAYEGDPTEAAKYWDTADRNFRADGFAYLGSRLHVKPKKAPPSRAWLQHLECGRAMPKVTPYPKAPKCPWCDELTDRSMASIGHLPGDLYLLKWETPDGTFLKVGIAGAGGRRIVSQVQHGATVVQVRRSTVARCKAAETRILRELKDWSVRPVVPLALSGDTECLHQDAPIGHLAGWFETGISGQDVTTSFK